MKKFFEPLSIGTPPREVAATLPALLNSIKMIFTISRYFGTPDKIAALFAKITHQMIRNCQKYAYKRMEDILLAKHQLTLMGSGSVSSAAKSGDGDDDDDAGATVVAVTATPMADPSMWDIDDDARDEILSRCMRLNELYQAEYFEVKKSMEEAAEGIAGGSLDGNSSLLSTASSKQHSMSGGSKNQTRSPNSSPKNQHKQKNNKMASGASTVKVFGSDDQRIVFGEFDMFCRRLIKLEDLFSTIKQFQPLLASKQLEMRELVNEFKSVVNDLKKKKHDLMAYENAQFDRDYLEFSVRYSELLDQIQHFVNRSFSNTLNVRDGLELLRRFSWMQSIERLQGTVFVWVDVVVVVVGCGSCCFLIFALLFSKHTPPFLLYCTTNR